VDLLGHEVGESLQERKQKVNKEIDLFRYILQALSDKNTSTCVLDLHESIKQL
jgi:hypothetical protein